MEPKTMAKSTKKPLKGKQSRMHPMNQASTSATETSELSSHVMVQPRRSFWKSFSNIFKCSTKRRPMRVEANLAEGTNITTIQSIQSLQEERKVTKDTDSIHDEIQDMKTMLKKYSISPKAISMVQRIEQNRIVSTVTDIASSSDEDVGELKKVLLKNQINMEKLQAIEEESEIITEPSSRLRKNTDNTSAVKAYLGCSVSELTVDKDTDSFEYSESESMVDVTEERGEKVMFNNNVIAKDENNIITVNALSEASQEFKEDTLQKNASDCTEEMKQLEKKFLLQGTNAKLENFEEQYKAATDTVNDIEMQLTAYAKQMETAPLHTADNADAKKTASVEENANPVLRDELQQVPVVDAIKIFGAKIMDNHGSNLLRHLHDMRAKHPDTKPGSSTSLEDALTKSSVLNVPMDTNAPEPKCARCITAIQSPLLFDDDEEEEEDEEDESTVPTSADVTDYTISSESLNEIEVWSKHLNMNMHALPLVPVQQIVEECPVHEDGVKEVRLNNLFTMVLDPVSCAYSVRYEPSATRDGLEENPQSRFGQVPRKQKLMSLLDNVAENEAENESSEESGGQHVDATLSSSSSWASSSTGVPVHCLSRASCTTLYQHTHHLDSSSSSSCSSSSAATDTQHFINDRRARESFLPRDSAESLHSHPDFIYRMIFRSKHCDLPSMMNELLVDVAELKEECLAYGVQEHETPAAVVFKHICEGDFIGSASRMTEEASVQGSVEDSLGKVFDEIEGGKANGTVVVVVAANKSYEAEYLSVDADKLRIFKNIDEDLANMIQALIDVPGGGNKTVKGFSEEIVEDILENVFNRSIEPNLNDDRLLFNETNTFEEEPLSRNRINKDIARNEADIKHCANEPKMILETVNAVYDYHIFFNDNFSIETGLVGTSKMVNDELFSHCASSVDKQQSNKPELAVTNAGVLDDDDDDLSNAGNIEHIQDTILQTLENLNTEISKSLQELCEHNSSSDIFQLEHKLSETNFVAPSCKSVLNGTVFGTNIEENLNIFQENMKKLIAVNKKTAEILKCTCGLVSGITSLTAIPCCSYEQCAEAVKEPEHGLTANITLHNHSENDSSTETTDRSTKENDQKTTDQTDKYQNSFKTKQQLIEANQNLTENLEKILSQFSEQFSKCIDTTPETESIPVTGRQQPILKKQNYSSVDDLDEI